jgi:hypothetical protein
MSQLIINGMDNSKHTPNKQDAKPSQQPKKKNKRHHPHLKDNQDDYGNMMMRPNGEETFRRVHSKHTKQLIEHAEKHAMEIAAMKQTNMERKNLLTMNITPAQPINDHIASAHFTAKIKPSEILFDGKPENGQNSRITC